MLTPLLDSGGLGRGSMLLQLSLILTYSFPELSTYRVSEELNILLSQGISLLPGSQGGRENRKCYSFETQHGISHRNNEAKRTINNVSSNNGVVFYSFASYP